MRTLPTRALVFFLTCAAKPFYPIRRPVSCTSCRRRPSAVLAAAGRFVAERCLRFGRPVCGVNGIPLRIRWAIQEKGEGILQRRIQTKGLFSAAGRIRRRAVFAVVSRATGSKCVPFTSTIQHLRSLARSNRASGLKRNVRRQQAAFITMPRATSHPRCIKGLRPCFRRPSLLSFCFLSF